MKNLEIENKGNQMILKINKDMFDKDYLISLVKRLKVEELACKSELDSEILNIAEEINEDWWKNNSDNFLMGIKK